MIQNAPPVVDRYLAAADASDPTALADCFTPDGTVVDEDQTYRGRAEITAWREALASRWTYTTAITGSRPLGADSFRVEVRIEGDFPGGVANLAYRFTLRDDLIASLVIDG